MVAPVPCTHCKQTVVWLATLAGQPRPFWAEEFPAGLVHERDQWAVRMRAGRPVAVPLDGDRTPNGKVLMQHYRAQQAEHELMKDVTRV